MKQENKAVIDRAKASLREPFGSTIARLPEPTEPPMKAKAAELLRLLFELGEVQDDTQAKLFGPFPKEGPSGKDAGDPGLEELLAHATALAASLVGQAKTINARI